MHTRRSPSPQFYPIPLFGKMPSGTTLFARHPNNDFAPHESKQLGIPKKIHLIWFGGTLNDQEKLNNIRSWKNQNPNSEVVLWVHKTSDIHPQQNQLASSHIEVRSLESVQIELDNYDLMEAQLANKNWSAASDIARVDLIASEGGLYTDVGNFALHPLDQVIHPSWKCFFDYDPQQSEKMGSTVGKYSLHAATPNHPVYRQAQKVLRKMLTTDLAALMSSVTNPAVKHCMTIGMTGTAVFMARDILLQTNEIDRSQIHPLDTNRLARPKAVKPPNDSGENYDSMKLFAKIFSSHYHRIKQEFIEEKLAQGNSSGSYFSCQML